MEKFQAPVESSDFRSMFHRVARLGLPQKRITNAYYFVDACSQKGTVRICFQADRPTNLGSPVVIVREGETARVPLLIGVCYRVTSTGHISLEASNEAVSIHARGENSFDVAWPLSFSVSTLGAQSGRVIPSVDKLNGRWNWTTDCPCEVEVEEDAYRFTCCDQDHPCGCLGCGFTGNYSYEGGSWELPFIACGCGVGHEPHEEEPQTNVCAPSVSIVFSKSAIIFEEAYQDEEGGPLVPKRSTESILTISAFGGSNGGQLTLSGEGLEAVELKGGGCLNLSSSIILHAHESYSMTYACIGAHEGGTVRISGIIACGQDVSGGFGTLDVARIDLQATEFAPLNICKSRHTYGLGEKIFCYIFPRQNKVCVQANDAIITGDSSLKLIEWGICECEHSLRYSLNNISYPPNISVYVPQGVQGISPSIQTFALPIGEAGGLELCQRFQILPLYVSFTGLAIEEVPCDEIIPRTGYFSYIPQGSIHCSHTRQAGAGLWYPVQANNLMGGTNVTDHAGFRGSLPRIKLNGEFTMDQNYGWMNGSLVWKIPFGWNRATTQGEEEPIKAFAVESRQSFQISADGRLTIHKLNHTASREISGGLSLDGQTY